MGSLETVITYRSESSAQALVESLNAEEARNAEDHERWSYRVETVAPGRAYVIATDEQGVDVGTL